MQIRNQNTVLLVQPDSELRSEIAAALRREGLWVAEAESGAEALALASQHTLSVALVGSQLPDIHSFELVARLREICPDTVQLMWSRPIDIDLIISLLDRRMSPQHVSVKKAGKLPPLWKGSREQQLEALLDTGQALFQAPDFRTACEVALHYALETSTAQEGVVATEREGEVEIIVCHGADFREMQRLAESAFQGWDELSGSEPLAISHVLVYPMLLGSCKRAAIAVSPVQDASDSVQSAAVKRFAQIAASSLARIIEQESIYKRLEYKRTVLEKFSDTGRAVSDAQGPRDLAREMLNNIKELAKASDCILFSVSCDTMRVVVHTRHDIVVPGIGGLHRDDTLAWTVLESGSPLFVDNLQRDGLKLDRLVAVKVGLKSALYVPLACRGRSLGVLAVGFTEGDPAGLPELIRQSLSALAAQAALVLDGMRLLEEAESQIRRLKALKDLASAASSTLELEALARKALDSLKEWIQPAASAIYIVDEDRDRLELLAHRNLPDHALEFILTLNLQDSRRFILSQIDGLDEIVVLDLRDAPLDEEQKSIQSLIGLRKLAVVPLNHRGKIEGYVTFGFTAKEALMEADEHLLAAAADQLATAIANARLYRKVDSERRKLESLFSAMTDCLFVFDNDQNVLAMNRAARELYGVPLDRKVIGKWSDYQELGRICSRDGDLLPPGKTPSDRCLNGETFTAEEFMLLHHDGKSVYYNISGAPIRDETGRVVAGINVARDITTDVLARRKMEEMAREAEQRAALIEAQSQRLSAMFDTIPGVIIICDETGKVIMTNRFGNEVMVEEFKCWTDAFNADGRIQISHPDGSPYSGDETPIARSISKGEFVWGEEMVLRFPSGNTAAVIANSAPIYAQDSSISGGVIVIQDISELHQAYVQLEHDRNREQKVAERLQTAFLPTDLPELRGFEVATKYIPALEEARVGGDFYDLFVLPDEKMGVIIADVSGKGLSAAVYTAMTKYMLQAYAIEDPSPASVIQRLNKSLCARMPSDYFVTLFYGVIDPTTRQLTYVNAGHEQPLLVQNSSRFTLPLDITGRALGLFTQSAFTSRVLQFESGDTLVLYTDGLTDYRTASGTLGVEGLIKCLDQLTGASAQRLVDELWENLCQDGSERIRDDVAILCLKAI